MPSSRPQRGLIAIGRSALVVASSTAAAQLIGVLVTPLLTRLYTPADFGFFGAFVAAAATLTVVSSLRYELAIPIEGKDRRAVEILKASVQINFAVALATLICGVVIRLIAPERMPWTVLLLLPFFLVAVGSYRSFAMFAIRRHEFLLVGRTKLAQAMAASVFQVASGAAFSIGSLGLTLGYILGQSVGLGRMLRTFRIPFSKMSNWSRLRRRVLLHKYRRFPQLDAPAALADTAGAQLPNLLLLLIFGPVSAGAYLIANRLLAAPATLLAQALGQSLLGSAAELVRNGSAPSMMLRVGAILLMISVSGCALAFFCVEPIAVHLLGSEWSDAGTYAKWIVLGVGAQFLYLPFSFVLLAAAGQGLNLTIHVALLLLKSLVFVRGYISGAALETVMELSLVNAFGYFGATIWAFCHVKTHIAKSRGISDGALD